MIVVRGRKYRTEVKGVVADRCALCRAVSKGSIESLLLADHLFFIALTPGEHLETRFRCHSCGGLMQRSAKEYDALLTRRVASPLGVAEVLQQTNRRLTDEIERLGEAEIAASKWLSGDLSGDDPRVDLVRLKLARADDDSDAARLRDRLSEWSTINEAERASLVEQAECLLQRSEYNRAVEALAHWGAQRFMPSHAGWMFVLGCFLAIVGLFLLARRGDEGSQLAILGGAAFITLALYIPIHRFMHRRFFRTTFLPEAAKRGVDPQHSHAWLNWRRSTGEHVQKDSLHVELLFAMAKASPRLAEVLHERVHNELDDVPLARTPA
jgi:hypothetical protein